MRVPTKQCLGRSCNAGTQTRIGASTCKMYLNPLIYIPLTPKDVVWFWGNTAVLRASGSAQEIFSGRKWPVGMPRMEPGSAMCMASALLCSLQFLKDVFKYQTLDPFPEDVISWGSCSSEASTKAGLSQSDTRSSLLWSKLDAGLTPWKRFPAEKNYAPQHQVPGISVPEPPLHCPSLSLQD